MSIAPCVKQGLRSGEAKRKVFLDVKMGDDNWVNLSKKMGFPGGSEVKASVCHVGDLGSIPGLGRSPGEGNGNPLQYSCLENSMGRGAWWATFHWVAYLYPFTYLCLSIEKG